MRKSKKMLSLFLVFVMILSMLTGCSKESNESNKRNDSNETNVSEESDASKESDETRQDEISNQQNDLSDELSKQEPYVVKIAMVGDAATDDCNAVAEAASKITEEKFNTTIELVRFGYGSYMEELNLMLASGEKLDLFTAFRLSVTAGANAGQIIALDELLENYGQDILADIPKEDWKCTSLNGSIYGVRNNKELASGYGIAMVTEILETLETDITEIKSEEDLTALFREVKEKYPNVYPIVTDRGTMEWYNAYLDPLGGDFGVLEDCTTDSSEVVNWFDSETYKELVNVRHSWVTEGLMMPDPSTNSENATDLLAAGKGFSFISNTKPGIDGELERQIGKNITVLEITPPFSLTESLSNMWYIPPNSQSPDRAMQVLNEIYSNPELTNILINGLEGTHFEVVDEEKGIIDYPEGVDASNTGYSMAAWAWPNELISYTWTMDDPNVWTDTIAFNKSAINSKGKGFMWDSTAVLSEVAACTNVKAKYFNSINTGELDPEEAIPKFVEELKRAGVDTIIAEKQRQFDEWLDSQE